MKSGFEQWNKILSLRCSINQDQTLAFVNLWFIQQDTWFPPLSPFSPNPGGPGSPRGPGIPSLPLCPVGPSMPGSPTGEKCLVKPGVCRREALDKRIHGQLHWERQCSHQPGVCIPMPCASQLWMTHSTDRDAHPCFPSGLLVLLVLHAQLDQECLERKHSKHSVKFLTMYHKRITFNLGEPQAWRD